MFKHLRRKESGCRRVPGGGGGGPLVEELTCWSGHLVEELTCRNGHLLEVKVEEEVVTW